MLVMQSRTKKMTGGNARLTQVSTTMCRLIQLQAWFAPDLIQDAVSDLCPDWRQGGELHGVAFRTSSLLHF